MKIVHIPRRYTRNAWGGTETCISELARNQVSDGHSVSIKTSLALAEDRFELSKGVTIQRFDYCYPYFGLSAEHQRRMDLCGGNMLSLPLLRNLLRSPHPDIIHLHTGKRMGAIGRTAAKRFGIPYVVSLHGGIFDVPQGFTQGQEPIVTRGEWGKAFGALLGARRVLEDADAIFCVNESEVQLASAQLPGKRIEYIPNGVDCRRYDGGRPSTFRERFAIPRDRKVLLNVGRIDPQKNQHMLVDACAALDAEDFQLVIIGPVTDESYAESLRQKIRQSGHASRITLIEGLEPDDHLLLSAYKAADLFCIPSIHEPFGIVVLEAWAAGKPVLASAVGGLNHLIRNGENGMHVENSVEAWRTAIQHCLANEPLMLRLRGQALNDVRKNYDWSVVSARVTATYEELIAARQEKAA